jgi:membrane protein implicated in regulation of membrane protease activity
MWLVYVIALILGGGTVLLQVLAGADHHVGSADVALDAHHAPTGPGILSTRSVTFAIFAFGLVGTVLHVLHLASRPAVLALAVASGAVAGLAAGLAFRTLGHEGASGEASFHEAKGQRAKVLVPCAREQRGKIRARIKGQLVDMMATTDEAQIGAGREVLIVDVKGDVAHVVTAPEALAS